jgi:hypothetical protein
VGGAALRANSLARITGIRPGHVALNEIEYRRLCDVCDEVLLASDSTVERIAIPWLHVLREHPVILSRYAQLFQRQSTFYSVRLSLAWIKDEAKSWLQIARAWRSQGEPWFASCDLPQRADFLLVSHLLNVAHAGSEEDFYFADLPRALVEKGSSAVIVLINHTAAAAPPLVKKWRKTTVPRVVPAELLPVSDEVVLHRRLVTESRRLTRLATREPDGLKQRVLRQAAQEALSASSAQTMRLALQIGGIVARVRPQAIVTTHEGHAYERMFFAAARSVSPAIRCIGYQHAALFRLQHAIKRNLAPAYNPDRILTAGSVSKEQLEEVPALQRIPIDVLGSNRALDTEAIELARKINRATHASPERSCLVVPEGFHSEYDLLFVFAVECAARNPKLRFVLRTHPILSFEAAVSKIPRLRNLPHNVEISTLTLEQDLARCRWALYRGSTAIVQATLAGLRPVYLSIPGELSIDPLYQLDGWRSIVQTPEDLLALIDQQPSGDAEENSGIRQRAYEYCRRFFLPLDPAVLLEAVARPPVSRVG